MIEWMILGGIIGGTWLVLLRFSAMVERREDEEGGE